MKKNWIKKIAIVMITYNRCSQIIETLSIMQKKLYGIKCVVVDNGSIDDTTKNIRKNFPGVILIRNKRNLGAIARNQGVQKCKEPYIAFCDDDTWWERLSLFNAVEFMETYPHLGVITGLILVEPNGSIDPICDEMHVSPLPYLKNYPGHPIISFLAGASVIRKTAFLQAGGFNSTFFFNGEEQLLSCDLLSLGWYLSYIPEVIVHHKPSIKRDRSSQTRRGIRNALWFTWLRRPLFSSIRRTALFCSTISWNTDSFSGFIEAFKGMPWVIKNRRCIKPEIEALYKLIENDQLSSKAVKY